MSKQKNSLSLMHMHYTSIWLISTKCLLIFVFQRLPTIMIIYYIIFVISRTKMPHFRNDEFAHRQGNSSYRPRNENIKVLLLTPASARDAIAFVPISSV